MEKLGINLNNSSDSVALISVNDDYSQKSVDYKKLRLEVTKIKTTMTIEELRDDIPKESTLCLFVKKSFTLVALTLGIIESGFPFCYINEDEVQTDLADYNSQCFFSEKQMCSSRYKLLKTQEIFDTKIYFYKLDAIKSLRIFEDGDDSMFKICYIIKTSGTSGQKKIVHVTYNSIKPNITSLSKILNITQHDVILSVTPISFDPFLIDLFLSLRIGASLVFVSDGVRFDPNLFSKKSIGATFLQTTPSLFQRYGINNIRNLVLSENSSLKYLLLGGEALPIADEIRCWQDWDRDDRKQIFNLYGITEMSCWASIHEIQMEDFKYDSIPLGTPLEDTKFAYYKNTENGLEELVLITKSRVCFIDNSNTDKNLKKIQGNFFAQRTGDFVMKIDGKLFWYGRANYMIKRFGERINVRRIEMSAIKFIGNSQVACVFTKKCLVLFYRSTNDVTKELQDYLKNNLKSNEIPDEIRKIEFLPVNEHGKINRRKLREIYAKVHKDRFHENEDVEKIFIEAINQMFNLKLNINSQLLEDEPDSKRIRSDFDSTFQQLGGKSCEALRISMMIEDRANIILLPKLLDNQFTIRELYEQLSKCVPKRNITKVTKASSSDISIQQIHSYDLSKCVDSTPSLLEIKGEHYVSIGSHSNKLININVSTLSVASSINLSDRIECEVSQFKNFGVVGCYDGLLYCFDVLAGSIVWKYDSKAMIKSKPLVIDNEIIIFANYDSNANMRCIKISNDSSSIHMCWSKMLGTLGIVANLLRIDGDFIIVATLSSTVHKVSITTGNESWCKQLQFPVFSSPQRVPNSCSNEFLVAEVTGNIHCIDFNGNTLWTVDDFEGQIFSSFIFSPTTSGIRIIFGSHDKNVHILNYQGSNISVERKIELQSQIYSTPNILRLRNKEYIVSSSTRGYVNFISLNEGVVEHSEKLPGEIFSSPCIYKNMIFIGCRDNHLYTLVIK